MNNQNVGANAKDENYWKILNAVLHFEVTKGHLKWKVAEVARSAGVTRTLIYYYFGKSKMDIINAALMMIGEEFFGLSQARLDLWKQGRMMESVWKTRELVEKTPSIGLFYMIWRKRDSDIQKQLMALEKRYYLKLREYYPKLTQDMSDCILAVMIGLMMAPHLKRDALQTTMELVFKSLNSTAK